MKIFGQFRGHMPGSVFGSMLRWLGWVPGRETGDVCAHVFLLVRLQSSGACENTLENPREMSVGDPAMGAS